MLDRCLRGVIALAAVSALMCFAPDEIGQEEAHGAVVFDHQNSRCSGAYGSICARQCHSSPRCRIGAEEARLAEHFRRPQYRE